MKNAISVKTALLLVLGLTLAACSSEDDRSMLVVDLQLPAGVAAPATVHLTIADATGVVKEADVAWTSPEKTILEVGLYIPAGVVGPVIITARGMTSGVVVFESAIGVPVLQKGASVGPYPLVLLPVTIVPPAYDGGVDAGIPDVVASEAGPIDGVVPDAGVSEAGVIDGPAVSPDGLPDVPPDAPLQQPDAPTDRPATPPADAAIDTMHVPNWEPAQNIENDPINASYGPTIGMDPKSEDVYAAWTEPGSVKVKRWTRSTGVWEKTVVVDNRGSPQEADIGVDGKGNVILVWCQDPNTKDESLMGAWSSRTTDGVAWSPPVRIATPGAYNIKLAVARNGTAHAVYQKKNPDIQWPLYTAYFDGTSWFESENYIDTVFGYAAYDPYPLLVLNPEGDGILIYNRWAESDDQRIGAVKLTGATFGAPETMNPNHETVSNYDRSIAMNRKGEAIFVWSEGSSYEYALYVRTYNPSLGWSSPSPPITNGYYLSPIAAALDEQGNATLVWQQNLTNGKSNLLGIHGSPTAGWGEVAPIETDNLATHYTYQHADPKMATDESGNVFIAWRKDRSVDDVKTYGAYGSRFSFATKTWAPQVKLGEITGLNVVEVSLAVSDRGFAAADFTYIEEDAMANPDAYNTMVSFYR